MAGLSYGYGGGQDYLSRSSPAPISLGSPLAGQVSSFNGIGASAPMAAAFSAPQVEAPSVSPQVGAGGVNSDGLGLDFNLGTGRLMLGGLQTLGNFVMANKSYKLAKDQFNYQKQITDTNLNNQIQSYNTALADRARNRAWAEGQEHTVADNYVEQNKMRR